MKKATLSLLSASFAALALTVSACVAAPELPPVDAVATPDSKLLTLKVDAGEVLQFAMFKPRDGAAALELRKKYFRTAIPYAQAVGNVPLGSLVVQQTMIGESQPDGIALYKFPTETAMAQYQSAPDWPEYKYMRREGWEELDIYSITMSADMQLSFDPNKNYTIAVGWTNPGTEAEYDKYLDGIEPDFGQIGARFLARFKDVNLQSLNVETADPSHLTLVEWSGDPNLEGLQASQGYKSNLKSFRAAISRFDFYWVGFPTQPRGTDR